MNIKISDVYFWAYVVVNIALILMFIFIDKEERILLTSITFHLLSLFGYIVINIQQEKIKNLEKTVTELEIKD